MSESTVCAIPGALELLHARYFAPLPNDAPKPKAKQQMPSLGDDAALIEKAGKAKNGAKFRALMAGDYYLTYPSQSEADVALCSLLAFWTQDPVQIDRIFRTSGLFRDKWDKKHHADGSTYGEGTIQKALDGLQTTYQPQPGKPPPKRKPAQQNEPNAEKPDKPPSKPTIQLVDGDLPRIISECQDILTLTHYPVFRRVNGLVRPLVIKKDRRKHGQKLEAGTLLLEPVTEVWLAHELTKLAVFEKYDKREKEWLKKDCPPKVAKTLLDISGQWRFPYLAGTIEAPTLRLDGSLLKPTRLRRGYRALFAHAAILESHSPRQADQRTRMGGFANLTRFIA